MATVSRANRLKELRDLKKSGKKRGATYVDIQQDNIYDELDDEGYRKVVRDRLDRDDFIVDDNGAGYVDNGQDEFERNNYNDESDDDRPEKPGHGKKAKESKSESSNKINSFFRRKPPAAPSAPRPAAVPKESDQDFMAGILAGVAKEESVDTAVAPSKRHMENAESHARPRKRFASPPLRNVTNRSLVHEDAPVAVKPEMPSSPPGLDTPSLDIPSPLPNEPVQGQDEGEMEDEFEVRALDAHVGPTIEVKNMNATKYVEPRSDPVPSSDTIDASTWTSIHDKLDLASSPPPAMGGYSGAKVPPEHCTETDGSMNFFWMDYLELGQSLYLFGKVLDKKQNKYVSAMVKLDGVLRKLYFLPRERRQVRGKDSDIEVEMQDVYTEVSNLMSRSGVRDWKSKVSSRKYAFELPGVPSQSDYLKVLYPYASTQLPLELEGETFSRVFGTNTAMFEQFVLARNIMGPCWLKIKNPDTTVMNSSWCKVEMQSKSIDDIAPLDELVNGRETPLLTAMSVAMRTIVNPKLNKQEIVAISCRVYENIALEDPTPAQKLRSYTFTVVRPHEKLFPVGFENEAKKHRGQIRCERTEAALLNSFVTRVQNIDPDVIMGHQWDEVDYAVLMARMKECNTQNWHRIGRMKRSSWPKTHGGRSQVFLEKQIGAGRLACDLGNELGKSLIKAQSWSLTEIVDLQLGIKRQDVEAQKALNTWASTARGLVDFLSHCETDTYYIAAVGFNVQMLPLTKILTNLAGNSWARTLTGTRSERNEFILLHEFTRNKYICPDKTFSKAPAKGAREEDDDEDEVAALASKKKDKYKGGLVFEPQKGLYDKFILVMDFNSLYPSIIQEYNICFTTVERHDLDEAEDTVAEPPDSSQPQGILPRLIAALVNRRRQVKSLMKDKKATVVQKLQWDIKQQALKLTANSMYGCLGYTKSRFYARPLAVLTTFKGREVLTSTKELAESMMLQVIYGDTDSVMINTNVDNLVDAMKIGGDFKQQVNERYKLLEIDIDNVYQRMLLHAKKKYAALNLFEQGGKMVTKIDVKGLDMRRREYCALSKEASSFALDRILSGEPTESVIESIHEYLRDLSVTIKSGKIPVAKFIIYNALGKNPEDYPNAKTMPHVQVALKKKAKGESVRIHDVIPFVITGDESGGHVADRACSPQEVIKSDSGKVLDWKYYLANQILPPMERLCAPIEGTDRTRIAECLGLDPRRYQIHEASAPHEIQSFESKLSDSERFQDSEELMLTINGHRHEFRGLDKSWSSPDGFVAPSSRAPITFSKMYVQLQNNIQRHIDRYYDAYIVCDDPACGMRTRQVSVYGRRCLRPGCRGHASYEYSDKKLYNQLLYFQTLFDIERVKHAASSDPTLLALAEQNRSRLQSLWDLVQTYLDKSGRRTVDLNNIFSFMTPA